MQGMIHHADYSIEYFKFGRGQKIMFAFHGFNNHARDFKILEDFLGDTYTIVSFNIFFHGESNAKNFLVERGIQKEDFAEIFRELKERFPAQEYTLMGYSLGGRIVLKIMEMYPEHTEKLILLAPDGIRLNPFYLFLTHTLLGKKLLFLVIHHPSIFFITARILRKTGLVSEKKYSFARNNFDTISKREKVYLVWMILRKVISKKEELKNIIRRHKIPVYLFFGEKDKIIPPSIGWKFSNGVEKHVFINILDAGHKLINSRVMSLVAEKIKDA